MAGWHHWLDGHESGWIPGVGDGQGGLACCDSWGRKESNTTEWLNWTELNLQESIFPYNLALFFASHVSTICIFSPVYWMYLYSCLQLNWSSFLFGHFFLYLVWETRVLIIKVKDFCSTRETIKDGWNIDRGYLQKKRIDKRVLYSTHKSTKKKILGNIIEKWWLR